MSRGPHGPVKVACIHVACVCVVCYQLLPTSQVMDMCAPSTSSTLNGGRLYSVKNIATRVYSQCHHYLPKPDECHAMTDFAADSVSRSSLAGDHPDVVRTSWPCSLLCVWQSILALSLLGKRESEIRQGFLLLKNKTMTLYSHSGTQLRGKKC